MVTASQDSIDYFFVRLILPMLVLIMKHLSRRLRSIAGNLQSYSCIHATY